MDGLRGRTPPDTLPAPMRNLAQRSRIRKLACSLLALTFLFATCQFLAHYHVPQTAHTLSAHDAADPAGHGPAEHCSLCLQFDRLPAPPAPVVATKALFILIATVEAARLERLALDPIHLWPPSRGPPLLAS
jgi:hypothetical protein